MTDEQMVILERVFAAFSKDGLFFSAMQGLMTIKEYALGKSFKERAVSMSWPDFFG